MAGFFEKYEFAGIPCAVCCRERYIERQCVGYETDREPWQYFLIGKDAVEAERAAADRDDYPYGYLESLAFYRQFCTAAARENVILFHSSAISVDGRAYLFAAPSGTGKSTHVRLWRELLGDRAVMINDDKPLVRVDDGGITVYGTAWTGKHRLGANISAGVAGIVFLTRSENNYIIPLTSGEALPLMAAQTFRPTETEGLLSVMDSVAKMARKIPAYRLGCNISEEAARLSFRTLTGKEI